MIKALRNRYTQAGVAVVGSAASVAAHAELPAAATTAFTTIQTDGLALVDLAWPVMIAVTGGFILLGLFKKAAKKAAS